MTQNRRDAAPNGLERKRAANGAAGDAVTAAQVAEFLRAHPDFFRRHPELLSEIEPPARDCGEGVVDLQQYMVAQLRAELNALAEVRDELVVTGRNNLSAQARVHKATLALLGARNFEHFIETLTTDVAVVLDLDVITIGVEQNGEDCARTRTAGVVRLPPESVGRMIGPGQNIVLRPNVDGDPVVFGPGAGLIASEALLRLSISRTTPAALLALGSRKPEQFHPGQGTELLNYLARVVESCISGWLNLPE